jgi:tetrahydromethanopterin S-methyltransferase subunit G
MDSRMSAVGKEVEELGGLKTKIAELVKQAELAQQRIEKRSMVLNENIEMFREKFEKNRIIISNELEKIDSKIEQKVAAAASEVEKNNAESVHQIREESAALKAEMKNIKTIMTAVASLDRDLTSVHKRFDELSHKFDLASTATSSSLENEALKLGKDMAATAARLKGELMALLADEKEKFARESTGLGAKYDSVSASLGKIDEKIQEITSDLRQDHEFSQASRKQIAGTNSRIAKISRDIVGWKKEYKMELDKLLKELEG